MDSSTLHQLWLVVEETQTTQLLRLSDRDLIQDIIERLDHRKPLTRDEAKVVSSYLQARTPLIRDIAGARLACG
ncbi:MAG: hypothetical protein RML75_15460 [Cyanobacteriota bacterium SKYGB_h_bin112]|nr:hypothetical protein [Cyanobacteriota bacterium SKYGB_h_bin112]